MKRPPQELGDYRSVWSPTCLSGRVAIVTGVSSGIGAEIMRALDEVGAMVYGLSRSPGNSGLHGAVIQADVANKEEIVGSVQQIASKEGHIDVVVANAATWTGMPLPQFSLEAWQAELALNLSGPFILFQAALPHMSRPGGSFIAIGSAAGRRGATPGHVAYGASKAGLEGLIKSIAGEVGKDNIRANVVGVGRIDGTRISEQRKIVAGQDHPGPFRRAGSAREVAHAVIFLASPASSFVTGSVLRVDGGALYASGGTGRVIYPDESLNRL
jgi:meso-butanediol dehydrogenase/(S,S)-butanediol dehydrogenase/diacetyl reductase